MQTFSSNFLKGHMIQVATVHSSVAQVKERQGPCCSQSNCVPNDKVHRNDDYVKQRVPVMQIKVKPKKLKHGL